MVRVFYSPAYVKSAYDVDTTRKSEWIADSLSASPLPGIELVAPLPLTREQVARVHDPLYIYAIETGSPQELAESQGFDWDAGLWPMVCASNGGAVAAAWAAMEQGVAGSLSSGMHHARRGSGAGFCTLNGLAIAAQEALIAGAQSVLILDLDAHCGGGTADIIADDPRIWQIDISTSAFDSYDSTDRLWRYMVGKPESYLPTIARLLKAVEQRKVRFDLCLYNAGMDPCEDCSLGGLPGITRAIIAERERLVFDWCRTQGIPIAFLLAGGYVGSRLDEAGLVALHRLTLAAAVDTDF